MADKNLFFKNTLKWFAGTIILYMGYKLLTPSPNYHKSFKNYGQIDTTNNIKYELQFTADSLNKMCPIWVDSVTKLVQVSAVPNKTLQYNYALKIDTSKYNMKLVKQLIQKDLSVNIKIPKGHVFKDSGVTLIYSYTTMKMIPLFKFTFPPDKYK